MDNEYTPILNWKITKGADIADHNPLTGEITLEARVAGIKVIMHYCHRSCGHLWELDTFAGVPINTGPLINARNVIDAIEQAERKILAWAQAEAAWFNIAVKELTAKDKE